MTLEQATIRIARPTDDLDALLPFYRDGLGFRVLYEFRGHGNFDGVMLGHPGAPYHLEFTKAHGHLAGCAPTEDNLLVFYLPERNRFEAAHRRMRAAGRWKTRIRTGIASSCRMLPGAFSLRVM